MIFWLLIYTLASFADDSDPVIEEYCFSSPTQMSAVAKRLKFILIPVDKVEENRNCLTISTPAHRRELIQNYVRNLDSSVKVGFSSVEIRRNPCHIKVEKIRTKLEEKTSGAADTALNPTIGAEQVTQNRKDVTTIQTLKDFELTVNQDTIKGQCRVINSEKYEITIEVRKDAVPLLPPVPAGTIVIVPDAQLAKIQDTSKLQTTLQLNRGERVELGSVVKNLKADGKKIDISSGAALELNEGSQLEQVYILID